MTSYLELNDQLNPLVEFSLAQHTPLFVVSQRGILSSPTLVGIYPREYQGSQRWFLEQHPFPYIFDKRMRVRIEGGMTCLLIDTLCVQKYSQLCSLLITEPMEPRSLKPHVTRILVDYIWDQSIQLPQRMTSTVWTPLQQELKFSIQPTPIDL